MKFAKTFLGLMVALGVLFGFPGASVAQTLTCDNGNGTCETSSACPGATLVGGTTACSGNNNAVYCCSSGGESGSQEGGACMSPGGQSGRCYNTCPGNLSSITRDSTACSSRAVGINCCVAGSDGGGGQNACLTAGTGYFCSASSDCGGTGFERLSSRDTACGTGRFCCHPTSTTTGGGGGETGGGWTTGFESVKTESELPGASVSEIVSGFMMWLLTILGFIAIIAFVVAGILYLTAAGNDSQIKTAKTAMTWSVVGVIVALVGYVVVLAADYLLSGSV